MKYSPKKITLPKHPKAVLYFTISPLRDTKEFKKSVMSKQIWANWDLQVFREDKIFKMRWAGATPYGGRVLQASKLFEIDKSTLTTTLDIASIFENNLFNITWEIPRVSRSQALQEYVTEMFKLFCFLILLEENPNG